MNRISLVLFAVVLAGLLTAGPQHVGPDYAYPPAAITGAVDPAVTQANIHKTVCVTGYTSTVRAVSSATKAAVLERDKRTEKGCCEVDHFLSLEIGGSNDPDTNLWAQPYDGEYGARKKDVVETALHRKLCKGEMTLAEVQACITNDWIACGQRIGVIR